MMERLFKTHEVRIQEDLNGMWEFQRMSPLDAPIGGDEAGSREDAEGMSLGERKYCLLEDYSDTMAVPSCWEMTYPYCTFRGTGAYRRRFSLSHDANIRLVFKGVSHTAEVYIDGRKVGYHYNAYTPFTILLPHLLKGEHTLELLVDNSFSDRSMLHISNDYFTYGGITRPVYLEEVPDVFAERVEVTPFLAGDDVNKAAAAQRLWKAHVRIYLRNLSDKAVALQMQNTCGGTKDTFLATAAPDAVTITEREMTFPEVRTWTMEEPVLYLFHTKLLADGRETDDLTERIGFRIVDVRENKICLNGEKIFLKGVNRHEDHGTCGCAIPLQVMDADIKLIKAMGANAVRTCHYPNDERFLDLCDANGILVWEESHARIGDTENLTRPLFIEQSMECMKEMMENHSNHPSILIWGCLNESASHKEESVQVYRQHMDFLKKDASRLSTYASCHCAEDLCLSMEDVCSFNCYPMWYGAETPEDCLDLFKRKVKESGNAGKPIIISEFGGGAVYNFHDVMRVKWSEEYQADLLERTMTAFVNDPAIAGVFIWQFCDTRISQEGPRNWPMQRPLSRNNKGLVDEFRRPKLGYYTAARIFQGQEPV